jgi:hypothetical protein
LFFYDLKVMVGHRLYTQTLLINVNAGEIKHLFMNRYIIFPEGANVSDWKTKLENEFHMAENARSAGNEGKARVCARRAAGIAIREYMERSNIRAASASAYDLLNALLAMDGLPPDARQAAERLTLRVDEEFKLPEGVDLIREARTLCERLLPGEFK